MRKTAGLEAWASKRRNLEVLVESLKLLVECCGLLRLRCTDPPLATTGMLYSMGYHQYLVRSFWAGLPRGVVEVPIYKAFEAEFYLELEHILGPVWEAGCGDKVIPVDRLDSRMAGARLAPHSHVLYARIKGRVEGNMARINIVRISRLLEAMSPGSLETLGRGILEANNGRTELLEEWILGEVKKWRGILLFILPKLPGSRDEVRILSPVLRQLLSKHR